MSIHVLRRWFYYIVGFTFAAQSTQLIGSKAQATNNRSANRRPQGNQEKRNHPIRNAIRHCGSIDLSFSRKRRRRGWGNGSRGASTLCPISTFALLHPRNCRLGVDNRRRRIAGQIEVHVGCLVLTQVEENRHSATMGRGWCSHRDRRTARDFTDQLHLIDPCGKGLKWRDRTIFQLLGSRVWSSCVVTDVTRGLNNEFANAYWRLGHRELFCSGNASAN